MKKKSEGLPVINKNSIFNKMKNLLKIFQISHVNHLTPIRKKKIRIFLQKSTSETTSDFQVNSKEQSESQGNNAAKNFGNFACL